MATTKDPKSVYGLTGNGGLPSDMVTSEIIGDRKLKVSIENLNQLGDLLSMSFAKMHEQNTLIINELKLLNLRFEEMANTNLTHRDIGK